MLKLIDSILQQMRICFKRKEAFTWFVVFVFGMMVRLDKRGVTSVISTLNLKVQFYECIIHFFRSKAYDLKSLKYRWIEVIQNYIQPELVENKIVLIGDHIKISKEAKYMPAVKKHHQESENAGKSEYIFGHQHGVIGILAKGATSQCVPLNIEVHDGAVSESSFMNTTKEMDDSDKENSIEKVMKMAKEITQIIDKKAILLLDAFFTSGKAFKAAVCNNIVLITRAKSNTVAYLEYVKTSKSSKGRKGKYGPKIVLRELFEDKAFDDLYTEVCMKLYDKEEKVQYILLDLIWKPFGDFLRFVMVKSKKGNIILVCSDLTMTAETIIKAYSYRFKIEVSFKQLKHTVGGLFYHFWTKAMPKIKRWDNQTELTSVNDKHDQERILATFRAIEVFSFIGCIALGILTILGLKFSDCILKHYVGYLRTRSSEVPTPEVVKTFLQENLTLIFRKLSKYATLSNISNMQKQTTLIEDDIWDSVA